MTVTLTVYVPGHVDVVVIAVTPASLGTGAISNAPIYGVDVLRVWPTMSVVMLGLEIGVPACRAVLPAADVSARLVLDVNVGVTFGRE